MVDNGNRCSCWRSDLYWRNGFSLFGRLCLSDFLITWLITQSNSRRLRRILQLQGAHDCGKRQHDCQTRVTQRALCAKTEEAREETRFSCCLDDCDPVTQNRGIDALAQPFSRYARFKLCRQS